jgi:hypothetical protein
VIYFPRWPNEFVAASPLLPDLERIEALSSEDKLRELAILVPQGDPLIFAMGFKCYLEIRPSQRWVGHIALFPELEEALLLQAQKFLAVAPRAFASEVEGPIYLTALDVLTDVGYGMETVDLISALLAWNKDPEIQSLGLSTKFEVIRMTKITAERLDGIVQEMAGYLEIPEIVDLDFLTSFLALDSAEPMRKVFAACIKDSIPVHLQVYAFKWTLSGGSKQNRAVAMVELAVIQQHWIGKDPVEDYRTLSQYWIDDIVRYAEEYAAIPGTVEAIRKAKRNAEAEFVALDNLGSMWEELSVVWLELLLDPSISSYKKTEALQRLLSEAADDYSQKALEWLLEQEQKGKSRRSWLKLAKEYDPDWRNLIANS